MPCKTFLAQLRKAKDDIEGAGGAVVAIGRTAVDQARHLEQRWVPYPCLTDPDGVAYAAVGIRELGWTDLVTPRKAWQVVRAYTEGFAAGTAQGRPSKTRQLPGVAVFDADRRLRWVYRGQTLGDYPALDRVLDALRTVG